MGHFHSRADGIIAIVKGLTILAFGSVEGIRVVPYVGYAALIPSGLMHQQLSHGQVALRPSAPFRKVLDGIC